ncbi:MAG TPA: hypothetical protein VEU51_17775 [Candidatus Acidoferrales bacterium]|nr:hypothetical protein [Candidatus Acidoferrales bacterium]
MAARQIHAIRFAALAAVSAFALACWPASVSFAGVAEEDVPATSIVPAGSGSAAAAPHDSATAPHAATEAGVMATPATKPKPAVHHAATPKAVEVEPGNARLKLLNDAWVLSAPAKNSKHLEQVHKDKFVVVTGSTRDFLQVKLKSGATGYLDPLAVEMTRPADKVFQLTHDAGVLDKPNRWGKKVAEVHTGHNVHVVGLSLDYMKIRMKSGLEGYIPMSALE